MIPPLITISGGFRDWFLTSCLLLFSLPLGLPSLSFHLLRSERCFGKLTMSISQALILSAKSGCHVASYWRGRDSLGAEVGGLADASRLGNSPIPSLASQLSFLSIFFLLRIDRIPLHPRPLLIFSIPVLRCLILHALSRTYRCLSCECRLRYRTGLLVSHPLER